MRINTLLSLPVQVLLAAGSGMQQRGPARVYRKQQLVADGETQHVPNALSLQSHRPLGLWLILLAAGGCASNGVYSPIADPDFQGPQLTAVRGNPEAFKDTPVRWGGSIARVENRVDETWIEVVEQPLQRYGRPKGSADSGGRFVARIGGFLDPAIYAEGRQITVTGALESTVRRDIGEHPYEFPVVAVSEHRLWQEQPAVEYYDYPPYYYDFNYGFGVFGPWYRFNHYYHPRRW